MDFWFMVNREVELSAGLSNVAELRQVSSGGLFGFPENSILELGGNYCKG